MRKALIILLPTVLLSMGQCVGASPEGHEGGGVNAYCPVQPDEAIDPDIYVEYEGEKVFFCCNRCRKKFLADPTAYLAALPQFATLTQGGHDHAQAEGGHDPGPHESAEGGDKEHDHARDHDRPPGVAKPFKFLGKFHPLVVHFPIALILVALLAEGVGFRRGSVFFKDTARFTLSLGAAGALAAVALGWMAAAGATYPGELTRILFFHRWLGVSSAVASVTAAVLAHFQKKDAYRLGYRAALLVSAVLVGVTGHLGAALIYGTDYFSW